MNNCKLFFVFALMLALSSTGKTPLAAEGSGSSGGNGGGTWVCQNNDELKSIRWARLVDLYEAQREFGLTIPEECPGMDYEKILALKRFRVMQASEEFFKGVDPYVDHVLGSIKYVDTKLTRIDDALYRVEPDDSECRNGTVLYVQTANYTHYDKILVRKAIWESEKFSALDKAALIMHEAVYAYLRAQMGDKDSVRARELVGYIFSSMDAAALKEKFEQMQVAFPSPNLKDMSFVQIRAGSFMMGSPANEADRWNNEKQHYVNISRGFELGATEVTQSQWFQVMGNNPSRFSKYENCSPITTPMSTPGRPNDPNGYVVINGVAMCPNNPVEQVSWDDVQNFISRLNSLRRDGYFYRLPTEAEWEYAARAGTSSAYSFGNDSNQLYQYAWFVGNSGNQSHAVASMKPNAWGLYDMHGNVWEWVQDWYTEDFTSLASTDPMGPGSGSCRVVRGGSWEIYDQFLRSAYRSYTNPLSRYGILGLRLVRTK